MCVKTHLPKNKNYHKELKFCRKPFGREKETF